MYASKPRRPNSFSEIRVGSGSGVLPYTRRTGGSAGIAVDMKGANVVSHLDGRRIGLVSVPFVNHASILLSGQRS